MLVLIGVFLSAIATTLTCLGFELTNQPFWYFLFVLVLFITYFIIFLNVYWVLLLLLTLRYRKKEFVGKVNKFFLFNVRMLAGFLIPLQGFFIKKKGFKNLPKEPSLILFNHVSDYDPWVLYKIMNGRYSFVGKRDLLNIPVIHQLSVSIGTLFVSHDKEENYLMVDRAVDYITNKQTSVVIAPEGTRNNTGDLKPFKHGGFNIAVRSNCPIILVGFKGMEDVLTKKKLAVKKVMVEVFDIIYPKDYENKTAGEIAEMCEERYRKYLGQ